MPPSSDGSTFNTDITADPSKFEAGFKKAVDVAASSSDQINAQFKKIGDTVTKVNNLLLGFTAVLAGGGALKKFITDANEWNSSAGKMAAQLGITTEKASVMNVALARLGIDTDTYLGAAQKLSKQVQSNGQAFEVLGVNVRDASGAYKPVVDLMGEVNQKLVEIKNPIEQNIAGQQVYGKGWAEVRGILRLTSEQMKASEERARQLGLIVGPEGVAMSKQYTAQMRDLGLVGKSIEIQFGNALLPVFTRIGSFMSQEGPAAGQVFARILEGVAFAASSLWLALKDMGDGLGALVAQGAALLSGDLAAFKAIGRARDEESVKNAAAYERLKANFGKGMTGGASAAPDTTAGPRYQFKQQSEGGGGADKSRMGVWESQLEMAKASVEKQGMLEGQYRERSLAENVAFWAQLGMREDLSAGERTAIDRKQAEAEMALVKQTFEQKVATLNAESAAYKTNTDEKLRIERELQAMYAQGTKQYEEAAKRINAIEREAAAQTKAVAQIRVQAERDARLQTMTLAQQVAQQDLNLGFITNAQYLEMQRAFEAERFQIAMESIAERIELAKLDPDKNIVEIERLNAEKQALERTHQVKMAEIQGASRADMLAPLSATFAAGEAAIARSINGILTRTMTLKQGMQSAWQGISGAVIGEISKIIAKKVAAWAVEKALTLAGIGAKASEAGAGAASSVASIPYVGPILAIAALASVMGAVMGAKSSVPSAYAGYDIPAGLNPMTQLHEKEMVLPAKYADVIRAQAEGPVGQAQSDATIHIHGSPDDTIKQRDLARLLKQMGRDFVFVSNR